MPVTTFLAKTPEKQVAQTTPQVKIPATEPLASKPLETEVKIPEQSTGKPIENLQAEKEVKEENKLVDKV